jgi:cbb3-type cytochrome oxidase cytochrome c subunit
VLPAVVLPGHCRVCGVGNKVTLPAFHHQALWNPARSLVPNSLQPSLPFSDFPQRRVATRC